jgi:hypothetical protein
MARAAGKGHKGKSKTHGSGRAPVKEPKTVKKLGGGRVGKGRK